MTSTVGDGEGVHATADPRDRTPVLAAIDVSRAFGAVRALQQVTVSIYAGEVVGLVGDNGAGKSTLLKILSGADTPDSGTVMLRGTPVWFSTCEVARHAGVETVYQDLALAPELTIAENIFLGNEPIRTGIASRVLGICNRRVMAQRAEEILNSLGIVVPSVESKVGTLSGGQRQAVAIARSVLWVKSCVLMDEPTAALGVVESEEVIRIVRAARDRGLAILVISHSMPEIFKFADRLVVLRHGRKVAEKIIGETSQQEIVGFMTGALSEV